ncbi:MAG: tRNA (5-methylaminomethyl-2-thiouridylate)-methyltransferase, partial [Cytophagia bacterium]|nr:tRNA (5-methylaminomethyl-2-thiouridylate)-methyltransferase [Cytophagia bacterium]
MQFIITNDGSHSLLNTELNETYHSVHGAVQESLHVFIKMGLQPLVDRGAKKISILEIGFG